ncbi:MAG: hypothetical protein ISS25_04665 [Nanoarchaeota archaeon]|nr:hypothetical protein [DPANN group archaeon]MBL7117093.1 hypothetical protein [Nanoarchaeota archaeon]
MFIDVAIPSGNEEEFIERAKKLGTNGIIFLYEKDKKENVEKVKKLNSKDFQVYSAILVKDKVSKKKYDFIFSKGSRAHFENKNIDVIFGLEEQFKKDNYHYRNSGLNHVLCVLAKEKKIIIAFSFNSVLNAKDKGLILGRMMQNVKLCKKYKVKTMIASFARKPSESRFWKDLISFGVVLGINPKEAKEAVLNRKV